MTLSTRAKFLGVNGNSAGLALLMVNSTTQDLYAHHFTLTSNLLNFELLLFFILLANFIMTKSLLRLLVVLGLLSLTACSTISGSGTTQAISVQTFQSDGAEIDGAKCDMTNDEGTWFVVTPGSTVVHRSNKDLQVTCRKPGSDVGTASVVSRTKGNMWGNVILGGGIGAIVDHNNGSAYDYPGLVKIYMGRANQKIDETSPQGSYATNTTTVPGSAQTQQVAESKKELNLDSAQKKCEELGFTKGTENYGNCVLKIAK